MKQNIGKIYDWSHHRYSHVLKDAQRNYEILEIELEQLDIAFIILVEGKWLITNSVRGIICAIPVGRSYTVGGAPVGIVFSGKHSVSLR